MLIFPNIMRLININKLYLNQMKKICQADDNLKIYVFCSHTNVVFSGFISILST